MLGPLRTLISVAFLAMFLWAAFTVKLGRLTFADHVDRIGQTPEAKELLDGARSRVGPTLDEVKQRVFGEYVEAPTHLASEAPRAAPRSTPAVKPAAAPKLAPELAPEPAALASRASTPEAAKLPGRRKPP